MICPWFRYHVLPQQKLHSTLKSASISTVFPYTLDLWPLFFDKNGLYITHNHLHLDHFLDGLPKIPISVACELWTVQYHCLSQGQPYKHSTEAMVHNHKFGFFKSKLLQQLWISVPAPLSIWCSWLLSEDGCDDKTSCHCMIWLVKSLFGQDIHFCSQTTIECWKGLSFSLLCY